MDSNFLIKKGQTGNPLGLIAFLIAGIGVGTLAFFLKHKFRIDVRKSEK